MLMYSLVYNKENTFFVVVVAAAGFSFKNKIKSNGSFVSENFKRDR